MLLRPMALADLPAVLDVQRACYPGGFLEDAATFTQRLQSPGNLSCVAMQDGVVCAYLAAYRSRPGKLTPLNGGFDTVAQPDTLYLHDLAVAPAAGQPPVGTCGRGAVVAFGTGVGAGLATVLGTAGLPRAGAGRPGAAAPSGLVRRGCLLHGQNPGVA